MDNIFDEIRAERQRQDEQWGGPEHDDGHATIEWFAFIGQQIDKMMTALRRKQVGEYEDRERLVKIAALAVAGIESIDRTAQPRPTEESTDA